MDIPGKKAAKKAVAKKKTSRKKNSRKWVGSSDAKAWNSPKTLFRYSATKQADKSYALTIHSQTNVLLDTFTCKSEDAVNTVVDVIENGTVIL